MFWIREARSAFVGLAAAFAASLHSKEVVSVVSQLAHLYSLSHLSSGSQCQMNDELEHRGSASSASHSMLSLLGRVRVRGPCLVPVHSARSRRCASCQIALRVTVAGSPDGHLPAQMAISVQIAAPVFVMLEQSSESSEAGSLQ